MPTAKTFIEKTLQKVYHPTVNIAHLGDVHVQCEGEGKPHGFNINPVNLGMLQKTNHAILCPKCQKQATAAALSKFVEGPA